MAEQIRLTMPTLAVLAAIAAARDEDPAYGLRISDETGLGPGTVYPILERLQAAGWVSARWETGQPAGRPRRRYYQMTGEGRIARASALAARAARSHRWVTGQPQEGMS
jgi:PadR family transcriptional regulator PadR